MPIKTKTIDAGTKDDKAPSYVLPRYLRFARTLALVSSATVGVAAGVAVISTSGCSCSGFCGDQTTMGTRVSPTDAGDARPDVTGAGGGFMGVRPIPTDAADDLDSNGDAAPPVDVVDAGSDDAGDTGGGPRPAPLLPRAWIA